ncbi:uncharacterized protein LOC129228390 [Uloborus diversus]|uniref:uncharacterized protein LOC129228390 n=1 Tax=Uloborus diversus TaxID=327109 RepID=UPI002409DF0A|nr:uncharacterized protein LOC129228390 [Uloborus diversus]
MYAIFEEIVGPHPQHTKHSPKDRSKGDNDPGAVTDQDANGKTLNSSTSSSIQHYARAKTKRHNLLYGQHSHSLPRKKPLTGEDSDDASSGNPLLDTISVLTYDPHDDSDDYYDLNGGGKKESVNEDEGYSSTKCRNESREKKLHGVEGDRDSIAYAGSSSIDSGYKSFCPTPEMPDPSIYGSDVRTNLCSNRLCTEQPVRAKDDTDTRSYSFGAHDRCGDKSHLMVGTKTLGRQGGQVSSSPLRDSPQRRSDSSLYDVNLDHLMYLRQSLLSAIQKCQSSKTDSCAKECTKETHKTDEQSSKTYQKTVRFNTDVEVSTLSSIPHQGEDSGGKTSSETEPVKVQQSKSILKDPLCANLRSQLESGAGDCTLEEEIDSLLYGRAEFYDLESVDDFPCSYVTMIEEKYRSTKPSLAKVRKLKVFDYGAELLITAYDSALDKLDVAQNKALRLITGATKSTPIAAMELQTATYCLSDRRTYSALPLGSKLHENCSKPVNESGENESSVKLDSENESSCKQPQSTKETSSPPSTTVSMSKTAKCRFTEVARCMLEIIEDLQLENGKDANTNHLEDASSTASEGGALKKENECYTTAAEYHVYEEIDYDFVKPLPNKTLHEVPPPLPARPSTLFVCPAPSPPPPRKRKSSPKKSPIQLGGATEEVRNRPKQRGNLYCLFADRAERRSLSRSLEREWRGSGSPDNHEDDYGFKKEFPSI